MAVLASFVALCPAVWGSGLGGTVLAWHAPAKMADGRTAAHVGAYRIYWGLRPGVYSGSLYVASPAAGAILSGLPIGLLYFAIAAIGTDGAEGIPSYEISRAVSAVYTTLSEPFALAFQ